ncbi:aldolase [Ramaria rubella]|nr:aldolase [Ramaria rubella]
MSTLRATLFSSLHTPAPVSLARVSHNTLWRRALATHTDFKFFPDPSQKYVAYKPMLLPDRRWPTKVRRTAPTWLSTDLRDGNQALPNPMDLQQKRKIFEMLVQIGFKEIEVAYPSASDVEFQFVRSLIEDGCVPDDVWLQVLTPCRTELVKRTMESVSGAKNVIVHIYLGTAQVFREVVFQKSRAETIDLAVKHTALVRDLTSEYSARYGTKFRLNYGVEGFSQAEPEFVVELCEEVKRAWGKAGTGNDRLSFNLAASVEVAPPNHFADQVEYFSRKISEREKVIVSLHPHNDMGTAVAAAQLGLLAGADRVEGCLLGHGERTGNVDLITMALNQFTQGISPHLDFSNLPHILAILEECTGLPVNPRLPYSGKLAFTAFSGSHQDAIKKGFQAQEKRHEENRAKGEPQRWSVPYLPFDPADIGCSYEAMIRVNSQSGKAGISTLLEQALGLELPREMQAEFYRVIQKEAERTGTEVYLRTIVGLFRQMYHLGREQQFAGRLVLRSYRITRAKDAAGFIVDAEIQHDGASRIICGSGSSAQAALISALGHHLNLSFDLLSSFDHPIETTCTKEGKLASYVQVSLPSGSGTKWGVGVSSENETAQLRAVVSATNVVLDYQGIPSTRLVDYGFRRELPLQRALAM